MDKIILEAMQFYAYHGVFEEEKKLGQKFEVDLEMQVDLHKAGETDCLEDTINYALVYEIVKDIVMGETKKLIESLASNIADELIKRFPIHEVNVKVKKLQPPIPGHLKSVIVELNRGVKL